MKTNAEIQEAIVTYTKTLSDITILLINGGADEIREDTWQGTIFQYPNIRVNLISNEPLDATCNLCRITVSFMVFAESASSQQSDNIAGVVHTTLHERNFNSNTITFSARTTRLIPAVRRDHRTWMSEVMMSMLAAG